VFSDLICFLEFVFFNNTVIFVFNNNNLVDCCFFSRVLRRDYFVSDRPVACTVHCNDLFAAAAVVVVVVGCFWHVACQFRLNF